MYKIHGSLERVGKTDKVFKASAGEIKDKHASFCFFVCFCFCFQCSSFLFIILFTFPPSLLIRPLIV